MKTLALLLLLPLFASCTFLEEMRGIAKKANDGLTKAQETYAKAEAKYEEVKAAADTDKDGETTVEEWLLYIGGPTGAGLLGLWKLLQRNKASDGRKTDMEKEIAVIKAKLPA